VREGGALHAVIDSADFPGRDVTGEGI